MKFLAKFFILYSLVAIYTSAAKAQNELSSNVEQAIEETEPFLPIVEPLFPYHLRDVAVCSGPDGTFYLTGTTDDNWGVAEGIRVWKSTDLKDWELLGKDGFVWTFSKDASNDQQREIKIRQNRLVRGIWAPEIHYIKGNFWLTYSVSGGYGSGLLKSTSGRPEGPYQDVKKDGSLVKGIDATLFQDTDGTVWYIWGGGKMKKLNEDMSDFTENKTYSPKDAKGNNVGYEGVNMYYNKGKYYLMAAEWNTEGPDRGHRYGTTNNNRRSADGRYDCMIATADKLTGPYSEAYIALPHGGHNLIFDDHQGRIWATMFGNDEAAAQFREQPALVQMYIDKEQKLRPIIPFPLAASDKASILYVSPTGNNKNGKSWKNAYTSIQKAVDAAKENTEIWIKTGKYQEKVRLKNKKALYLYGGFSGKEKELNQRDIVKYPTVIDGNKTAAHLLFLDHSEYTRIDGISIQNAHNNGEVMNGLGAAVVIKGGGESVRIANCTIRDNYTIGNGAGFYISDGASPLLVANTIENNEAHHNGGAIYTDCNAHNGYHTRLYHCNIKNNKAQANGGIAYFQTNLKQTGTLRFINCIMENNFTLLEGGNIFMQGGATLLMSHCTVVNNRGMSKGAAIATLGRVPAQNKIINCIFKGNFGNSLFIADAFSGDDPTIQRPGKPWTRIENCLFDDNKTLSLCSYSFKTLTFKKVEDINNEVWGKDNISGNAQFVNYEASQFTLKSNSPAIGKGTLDNSFPVDLNNNKRYNNIDTHKEQPTIGAYSYQ